MMTLRNTQAIRGSGMGVLPVAACCIAFIVARAAIGGPVDEAAGQVALGDAPASVVQRLRVVDRDGQPVPTAAVWFGEGSAAGVPEAPAVISQIDKQFVPELTVVHTGTRVEFPNQDAVAHHVYSFAAPNSFEFPLYKSDERPSVQFDHAGIVALGCNIHDSMLAYIVIVDAPYYAITDANGYAEFLGPLPVEREVHVWSARLDPNQPLKATLSADGVAKVAKKSRPDTRPEGGSLAWEDY